VDPLVALTIAGSDSGGGAGIAADLRTFAAHGLLGTIAITAVTAQDTEEVHRADILPVEVVEAQVTAVVGDLAPSAVKTGMLGSVEIVAGVGRWMTEGRLGKVVVVDPVVTSSSGAPWLAGDGPGAYLEHLVPGATVLTPNRLEAEALLRRRISDVGGLADAAADLGRLGPEVVVVKGGHLDGEATPDVVWERTEGITILPGRRIATQNDHGTGCTLSAAIACRLAQGLAPRPSVLLAKRYVAAALAGAAGWHVGRGRGPVAHLCPEALAVARETA
jgi:hydroxymethylpyrimidine/phosphomethylpyrimidine kinase